MSWKYEQSTGRLYQDGRLVEIDYAGNLTGKNNPDRQHVRGMGPLPRGTYRITGYSHSKGPFTIILQQVNGVSFGRSAFRIHGERVGKPPGFASQGCIIMSYATRFKMRTPGGLLEVVR